MGFSVKSLSFRLEASKKYLTRIFFFQKDFISLKYPDRYSMFVTIQHCLKITNRT